MLCYPVEEETILELGGVSQMQTNPFRREASACDPKSSD